MTTRPTPDGSDERAPPTPGEPRRAAVRPRRRALPRPSPPRARLAARRAPRRLRAFEASRRAEPALHAVPRPARGRPRRRSRRTRTANAGRPRWPALELAEASPGSSSSTKTASVAFALAARPRRRRHPRDVRRPLARDRGRLPRRLEGGGALPDDDKLAQLARAFWNQGVRLHVPAGVRLAEPDRHPLVRRRAGPGADRPHESTRRRRRGLDRRGARSAAGADRSVGGAVAVRRHARGHARPPMPSSRSRASRSLPDGTVAFQHRHAAIGEGATLHWALAQLGARLVRSRVDNRLEGDRSCVEQVEIVFGGERPALRPHLVHPPHRPRHDRQPALEGRAARRRAGLHEGHDRHRAERDRDGQLPGRVRDEPLQGGPLRGDPAASRSTSPTAAARPTRAPSGRSTRPSCSISRAAASRRTRPASSSSSASSSPSSRGSRSRTRRSACASCSKRNGTPGPGAGEPTPPRDARSAA